MLHPLIGASFGAENRRPLFRTMRQSTFRRLFHAETFGVTADLGELRAAVMLIFLTAIPMFTNMMHGLSYQGYSFALLVLELALSLRLVDEQPLPKRVLFAMAAIGFCQGWLGFDYAFVVAGAPLCVWFAVSSGAAPWREFRATRPRSTSPR